MATFPTITQSGTSEWVVAGRHITNHEVFTFTLQQAPNDVGALIGDVTVFRNTGVNPNMTSYAVVLAVVDEFLTLSTGPVTGNFESTGI